MRIITDTSSSIVSLSEASGLTVGLLILCVSLCGKVYYDSIMSVLKSVITNLLFIVDIVVFRNVVLTVCVRYDDRYMVCELEELDRDLPIISSRQGIMFIIKQLIRIFTSNSTTKFPSELDYRSIISMVITWTLAVMSLILFNVSQNLC